MGPQMNRLRDIAHFVLKRCDLQHSLEYHMMGNVQNPSKPKDQFRQHTEMRNSVYKSLGTYSAFTIPRN
jgi:hypothetical protein